MFRTVLALLLCAVPAAAAIVPGPELEVTERVIESLPFVRFDGHLATDGREYLAVWVESAPDAGIHAARLDAGGKRIDDTPIVIAQDGQQPEVVWAGDRYFVFWYGGGHLSARFVTTDGALTEPMTIATPKGTARNTYAAFNGRVIVVIWQDEALRTYRVAVVQPDGVVTSIRDLGAFPLAHEAALTSVNGTFFFITATYEYSGASGDWLPSNVIATEIHATGQTGTRMMLAAATNPVIGLRAASRIENALIAWTMKLPDGTNAIANVGMTALGPGPTSRLPAGHRSLQTVAADRTGYSLVYGDETTRLVARTGGTSSFSIPARPSSRAIDAATGTETMLLVKESRVKAHDLVVQPLTSSHVEPVTVGPRHQTSCDVAGANGVKLAVWFEYVAAERQYALVAARIGIDREPIRIAAQQSFPGREARVAWNGEQWLVVWEEFARLVGKRVARSGKVLDEAPIVLADDVLSDTMGGLGWDGNAYVVAFLRGIITRFTSTVTAFATRVGSDGRVQEEITLSDPGRYSSTTSIASGPAGSLIVWSRENSPSLFELAGSLLSPGGTVTRVSFPAPVLSPGRRAVAWNDRTFLVAGHFGSEVHLFLVSPAGVVTRSSSSVTIPPGRLQSRLDLEPFGDGFLLTWGEERTIYAATFDRSGVIVDPPAAVAKLGPVETRFGAAGSTFVYARPIEPAHGLPTRVFTREIRTAPDPPRRRAVR